MMKYPYRSLGVALFILVTCSTNALAQLTFDHSKTEPNLTNPYTLGAKREDVMKTAREIFKACAFPIDEAASSANEGKLLTVPVVYTRGVTARTDLEHLAEMPASKVRNWVQGRFMLEIFSIPIDATRTQLSVTAKISAASATPSRRRGSTVPRTETSKMRSFAASPGRSSVSISPVSQAAPPRANGASLIVNTDPVERDPLNVIKTEIEDALQMDQCSSDDCRPGAPCIADARSDRKSHFHP
jgi:hypothetical protein